MLSLFRILKRPLICPYRALYSTTPDDLESLQAILRSQPDKKSFVPAQLDSRDGRTSQIVWKPFTEHSFIRPHQLTYKSRVRSPRQNTKRPTLGPGAKEARRGDMFHQLGLDPLSECQNSSLLAGFMSEMGKIYGREVTGLTVKNQRRLGKAIRRARMMGVIPILSTPSDLYRRRR